MHHRGFSLIELSIVLVILGLLVGGILAGQSLIRAAELRAVGTEYTRWTTATSAFRDKYMAIPGDMANATAFWGTDSLGCPSGGGTGTCNGNGSGGIYWTSSEKHRFWQHLVLAGLINGNYTGIWNGASMATVVPGTNAPLSKYPKGAWGLGGEGNCGSGNCWNGDAGGTVGNYGNFFTFGAVVNGNNPLNPRMTTEDAWNLDTKTDDGKPATGKMITSPSHGFCDTASSNTDMTGDYKLNTGSAQCAFYFVNAF